MLFALAQGDLCLFALDGRADGAGRGLQRVQFGRAPLAGLLQIGQDHRAPTALVDEDGPDHQRLDALRGQRLLERGRQAGHWPGKAGPSHQRMKLVRCGLVKLDEGILRAWRALCICPNPAVLDTGCAGLVVRQLAKHHAVDARDLAHLLQRLEHGILTEAAVQRLFGDHAHRF